MVFSSFYGGRQGASFVIVKRFDAVTVATESEYKSVQYAVNPDGYFLYDGDFIERTTDNFNLYAWKWADLDGSTVDTINSLGVISQQVLGIAYKEGMVQCFMQGGDSTDIVNYGEYVIIDTVQKNDPDNGKVYRRGMNYDYDPVNNPLAGAEYIGQIVGPQGETPEINIDTETEVKTHAGYRSDAYNPGNGSIIPGYYVDGYTTATFVGTYYNDVYTEVLDNIYNPQEGVLYQVLNGGSQVYEYFTWSAAQWHQETPSFHDDITYSWVTMRDEKNNVIGALVGFTFPYLVEVFTATAVDAYYHRDSQGVPFRNMNLIERIDDGSHPYYQSWRIKVPEGIKGNTITKLEKINTVILKGVNYYYDQQFESVAGIISDEIELDTDNIDYTLSYIPVIISGELYYVPNNSDYTGKCILRYTETNYDRSAEGDNTFVSVGPYNIIKSIEIAANGDVFVDYTYDGRQQLIGTHLKWISSMVIAQNGHYTVTYNDNTTDEGDIHFIDNISIDSEGTVTYKYSDGTTAAQQTKLVKWITDVSLDGRDGNGTQKVTVEYNNDSYNGVISEEIGDAINYILEAVVSESRSESAGTPPYHLLVLYSDPVRRAAIVAAGNNATYRSIYPDANGNYLRNDWYDMGNVRGAKGGLGIMTELASASLLNDDSATPVPIPPEYIMYAIDQRASTGSYIYNPPQGMNPEYSGWLAGVNTSTPSDPYAMDIYFYDYSTELWNKVSGFTGGGADPAQVVRISEAGVPPTNPDLEEDGLWLITTPIKFAN